MRLRFIHIILLLFPFSLLSQEVELSRQVIGSSGQSFQNGELMISSTTGEAVIGSTTDDELIYTQGFHQSSKNTAANLSFDYAVKDETCPDTEDGQIILSNFEGCDNGNYTVEWENGETGFQISGLSAGWYRFNLIACGVIDQDSVMVSRIYENGCLLKFYTAFSPNGDNVNDLWLIDNIESVPNNINTVIIFNKWGDKVQDFVNYNNTSIVWNGKDDKGKEVTEGTYYYQVKINSQSYSGYIELTR